MIIHKLQTLPDWCIQIGLLVISSYAGYFLSIIIDRLPKALTVDAQAPLSTIRSLCPYCRKKIPWHHHIPLLHYFLSKASCHHHEKKLWFRPLVELVTVLISLIVYQTLGLHQDMLAGLILSWWLIALIAIDIKYYLLPDQLTLSLIWIGLLINLSGFFIPLPQAVLGACLGYLLLWTIDTLYYLLRKRNGIGQGDWKLLAALGAWFGIIAVFYMLAIAALLATLFGIIGLISRRFKLATAIPFGPFLCISAWVFLFFGKKII